MNKKQSAFFQPYSQSLQITNRLLSLTSKFPDFVLSWISSISRVNIISILGIMVSFSEGMCSCHAFLELLWLTLSSIQIFIVPLGSFVSTLWMLRLYTEEICSFGWLCCNELPPYLPTSLPTDQKSFSDFYENLQK